MFIYIDVIFWPLNYLLNETQNKHTINARWAHTAPDARSHSSKSVALTYTKCRSRQNLERRKNRRTTHRRKTEAATNTEHEWTQMELLNEFFSSVRFRCLCILPSCLLPPHQRTIGACIRERDFVRNERPHRHSSTRKEKRRERKQKRKKKWKNKRSEEFDLDRSVDVPKGCWICHCHLDAELYMCRSADRNVDQHWPSAKWMCALCVCCAVCVASINSKRQKVVA